MIAVDNGLRTLWTASAALVAKTPGGIWKLEPKQGINSPQLVYLPLFDRPHYAFGATPRLDCPYQLEGVGMATASQGASEVAEAIRDLAIQLVTGRTGSTWSLSASGYNVKRVFWERNLSPFTEVTAGGVVWVHAPAYFTIWLNPV